MEEERKKRREEKRRKREDLELKRRIETERERI